MQYPCGQRATQQQISCESKDRGKETHPCTTDAMDIVFAVIWEVVVLRMPLSLDSTQSEGNTHNDISDILDVYSDEARQQSQRQDAIDDWTHELNRTAKNRKGEDVNNNHSNTEPKQWWGGVREHPREF